MALSEVVVRRAPGLPRLKAWQYVVAVVGAVVLLQAVWIAVVPPFRGIDEFDHAYRAAAVADGQWEAGPWAENGRGRLVTVPRALVDAAGPQCAALRYTGRDNCSPVADAGGDRVEIASASAGYNPVFYWVVGTPGRFLDGAGSLYAMRVATALLAALFFGAAAWALTTVRDRRARWLGAAVPLALTPVALYSTTVVAPNGPEIAAGLAFWSALIALVHGDPEPRRHRGLLAVLVLGGVALGGLRELGVEFAVLIVGVVAVLDLRAFRSVVRRHRWALGGVAVATLATGVGQMLWRSSQASFGGPLVPDARIEMNASFLLTWPFQTVAAFPLRDDAAPPVVYAIVVGLFLALVVLAFRRSRTRGQRAVLGLFLLGAFLLPLVLTAATYSGRGVIWQGRYGLPVFVGLPLVCALLLGASRLRRPGLVLGLAGGLLAVGQAVGLLGVLADERRRDPSAQDTSWHQPSALLVALAVAAAYAVWTYALADRARVEVAGDDER